MQRDVFVKRVEQHDAVLRTVDIRPEAFEIVAPGVVLELENS